jgi:hypothetical protein
LEGGTPTEAREGSKKGRERKTRGGMKNGEEQGVRNFSWVKRPREILKPF